MKNVWNQLKKKKNQAGLPTITCKCHYTHIKNWEPFVFGPRLAIDSRNGWSCFITKPSSAKQTTFSFFTCHWQIEMLIFTGRWKIPSSCFLRQYSVNILVQLGFYGKIRRAKTAILSLNGEGLMQAWSIASQHCLKIIMQKESFLPDTA